MSSPLLDQLARLAARRASRRAALASGASLAGAAALAALAPRVAAQEATPAASPAAGSATLAHTDAEFLFVQVSPSATWAPKPGADGVYVLTLTHQDGQTIYFSDRPERIVGAAPTQAFLDGLGFTPANPPNAAIVAGEEILVVELTNPVYDPAAGTLAYDANPLAPEEASEGIGHLANQQTDQEFPPDLGPTSLFIDSAQASTCSQYTDCHFVSEGPVPGIHCVCGGGNVPSVRAFASATVGPQGDCNCSPGPVPGGPIDACWKWGDVACEACDGRSKDDLDQLCNDTYPQCAQYSDTGGCTVIIGE